MGSLNVGSPYTGVRYGSADFRDLNVLVQGHSTKESRDFFRDMLLRNIVHHPKVLDADKIRAKFSDLDQVFAPIDMQTEDQDEGISCKL